MRRYVVLLGLSIAAVVGACATPIVDPTPEMVMGRNGWEAADAESYSWVDANGPFGHRHKLDFHRINPPGTKLECQVAGGPWRGGDLSRLDAERLIAVVRKYSPSTAVLWVGGWQGIATVSADCGLTSYHFARVQGAWVLKKVVRWIT